MAENNTKMAEIEDVILDEINIIKKRRGRRYTENRTSASVQTELVGLALSGGGIRSAVTNLGVLYEMSRVGLFRAVDYLSTVSGGGYIGCCASSLLSLRKPAAGNTPIYAFNGGDEDPSLFSSGWDAFPFRDLPLKATDAGNNAASASGTVDCISEDSAASYGEDRAICTDFTSRDQVFHLRDRASFLIPRSLPFGTHVTRAIGAVSASTLLSLFWFFSIIVCLTAFYLFIAFPALNTIKTSDGLEPPFLVAQKANNDNWFDAILKRASDALSEIKDGLVRQADAFSGFGWKKWWIILEGILWGILAPFVTHLIGKKNTDDNRAGEDPEGVICQKQLTSIFIFNAMLLLPILFFFLYSGEHSLYPDPNLLLPVVFFIGCLAGSLIILCWLSMDWRLPSHLPPTQLYRERKPRKTASGSLCWNRFSRNEVSLCLGIFLYCLAGSYLFAILPAFILAGNSGFAAIVQAGLILALRYYLGKKKKKPAAKKEQGEEAFLAKMSRWLVGLMVPVVVLLAVVGVACFLREHVVEIEWPAPVPSGTRGPLLWVAFVAAILAVLISNLNFNNLSPHVFYKDRLAEAFLATFMRCFSGNETSTDIRTRMVLARNSVEMALKDLHGNGPNSDCAARGPYLLMNATLNLTAAKDLKGYRRQSANFLFSRCYTGSDQTGYLPTQQYNPPIEVGRAMTISGAAVTSVRGAQGSLLESFACTILGVRLGYWLRNPIDMRKNPKRKRWHWRNLFYELFRYTDSKRSHVYLSDGGHCGDNLGLIALLQRKTKLIIASDAECDPDYLFDSLTNSIRKAYVDHNIKVHISLDDLMPDEKGFTKKHFAMGRILYPDRPWQKSWLLVIKNTMTGQESVPIRNYRKKSSIFPHETTADQFFTEEQFEVYRSLGREAFMEIWKNTAEILGSEKWLRYPWSCMDALCRKLSPGNLRWDDIIRAIWNSETGAFCTWEGFHHMVKDHVRKMELLAPDKASIMVKQLCELDDWLSNNKSKFGLLQGKIDTPKSWHQFEEIQKNVSSISS